MRQLGFVFQGNETRPETQAKSFPQEAQSVNKSLAGMFSHMYAAIAVQQAEKPGYTQKPTGGRKAFDGGGGSSCLPLQFQTLITYQLKTCLLPR